VMYVFDVFCHDDDATADDDSIRISSLHFFPPSIMLSEKNFLTLLLILSLNTISSTFGFSLSMNSKIIYGIAKSGWASPAWNWGSAAGTGHDCALICRQKYSNKQSRETLVQDLISAKPEPQIFEEVKLVLGLTFQNGRWDGSDGGRGGYGDVLSLMAAAERYELGSEEQCAINFIQDLGARFHLLKPAEGDQSLMDQVLDDPDVDAARRRCSGLVLKGMGFIENGL
jgi:hypothetical protein